MNQGTEGAIQSGSHIAPWAQRWADGVTGWDQGGPHPRLEELLEEARRQSLLPDACAILEPGCGRAHSGATLARLGYKVTAFDAVPAAIDAATVLYGSVPNLSLCSHDALTPVPAWAEAYRAIYDRAVFCALHPSERRRYVEACYYHLAPGGIILAVPFTQCDGDQDSGPPFQVSLTKMEETLTPYFSLVYAADHELPPTAGRIRQEALTIWQKIIL